jgi:hypothetical protein
VSVTRAGQASYCPGVGIDRHPLGLLGGPPVEVPLTVVNLLADAVVPLTVPVSAVSLAVRFRRARGLERQQLRWLAFAAGLASVGALLVLAGTSLPPAPR